MIGNTAPPTQFEPFEDGPERLGYTIESFSEGKTPGHNEDYFGWNGDTIVLSDGASGFASSGLDRRTGGEISSQIVVETCLGSHNVGHKLVEEITRKFSECYTEQNIRALDDPKFRWPATMTMVRLLPDEIVITQVGDSPIRVNGTDIYANHMLIDDYHAGLRADFIRASLDNGLTEEEADIAARNMLIPYLEKQRDHQNNPKSEYGYGVLDGAVVPEKYIKITRLQRDDVWQLELASDGYFGQFPEKPKPTVADFEELREQIEAKDPLKTGAYASTKSNDDRTVVIIRFSQPVR